MSPPGSGRRPTGAARAAVVAAAVVGGALVVLVGHDGTPVWQVVRMVAVGVLGAGAWVLARRLGRRGRALLALAAGLVGVTVGVGIGVPHLAKTGLGLLSVVGLAALVAGVVLLVTGGRRLLRGRGWRTGIVVVPGLVVLVALALLTFGQALAATNVPRTGVGSTAPDDLGLAYRDVRVPTADGVTLAGWYVPGSNGAAVVVRHGAGSTRSSVLDQAAVLARAGYGVLLLDARGHGDSEGRAMDFGWYGDLDIGAAVDFLVDRPEVSDARVAVLGLSMGGEEAIGALAADERIRAVVAEGATNRVAGDKDWLSSEHGWRGWAQEQIDRVTYGATDLFTAADPPITLRRAVAEASPRPVLLIAGGDVPEEAPAARWIRDGSPDTVTVWVVPGAAHTDGLDTRPDEWEDRVLGFLDEALVVAGSS